MTRPVIVLRPEPGNDATVARLHALGLEPIACPLFQIAPLPWTVPVASDFDGLLLTSANTIRHGGGALRNFLELPVLAVGAATAAAAADAGFTVAITGADNGMALLAHATGYRRLLWLSGRDRTDLNHPAIAHSIPVYSARPVRLDPARIGAFGAGIILLHSTRAAIELRAQLDSHDVDPATIRIAAISAGVANAAGTGWCSVAIAATPDDDALIAAARTLAIDP